MRYHMLPKSNSSKEDSTEMVDVAAIGTRRLAYGRQVHLTEVGLGLYELHTEKSAEVIVVDRKRADTDNRRTHKLMED